MALNIEYADIDKIMRALGKSINEQVRTQAKLKEFIEQTGVPKTTLYRFFEGENIGLDHFLRILKGLQRMDLIESLMTAPEASPVDNWQQQKDIVTPAADKADTLKERLAQSTGQKSVKP